MAKRGTESPISACGKPLWPTTDDNRHCGLQAGLLTVHVKCPECRAALGDRPEPEPRPEPFPERSPAMLRALPLRDRQAMLDDWRERESARQRIAGAACFRCVYFEIGEARGICHNARSNERDPEPEYWCNEYVPVGALDPRPEVGGAP